MSMVDVAQVTRRSANELARLIAEGDISVAEVVEAHIARIEQVNSQLNAVVVKRFEQARAEAIAADEARRRGEPLGPLHGVPITTKDALDVAGLPSTYGLRGRAQLIADRDDPYVARLRQAGAIILGKTNVSQFLLYTESDNPLYGRTNNPWNVKRTPGGSSGGEAAIIAAGGSALGLGSDIGGSIRVPSAFCGIAGLKPTAGRLDDGTFFGISLGQRAIVSQVGPLARTVDDVALALEVLNGGTNPDIVPSRPLGDPGQVDVSRLRVAYYTDDGTLSTALSVRRAVTEAAGALAGRGAQVVEWHPPEASRAMDLFFGVLSADGAQSARELSRRDKVDPRIGQLIFLARRSRLSLSVLGALLRAMGQRRASTMLRNFGHRQTAHYWRLVEEIEAYRRRFQQALDTDDGGPFDLVICPPYAIPAFPHGLSKDLVTAGAYAVIYNVLGYPAGSVPVSRVREDEAVARKRSLDGQERAARAAELGSVGLPVGAQVVARPWQDHLVIAAMKVIEEAARGTADFPHMPIGGTVQ